MGDNTLKLIYRKPLFFSQLIFDDILGIFKVNINIRASKEEGIIILGAVFLGLAVIAGGIETYLNMATGVGFGLGVVGFIILLIGIALELDRRRRW